MFDTSLGKSQSKTDQEFERQIRRAYEFFDARWKTVGEIFLSEVSSIFPSCEHCRLDSARLEGRREAASRMRHWAFSGVTPEEAHAIIELGFPSCVICQKNFDSAKVYSRVIALCRCWAANGGSPIEIQEALNAAARPLGVTPYPWR